MKLQQVRELADRETMPQVINLADHPVVIERRKQLEALAEAERKFQGPCQTCRWREGSDWKVCTNPMVIKGSQDTISGEIQWQKPTVHNERGEEPYDFGYPKSEKRTPICGPDGILWEPLTEAQQRRRIVKKWLFYLVILGIAIHFFFFFK